MKQKQAKPVRDAEKVTILVPRETLSLLARARADALDAGARLSDVSLTNLIVAAVSKAYGSAK